MTFQSFLDRHGLALRPYGKGCGCYHVFESDVPESAKWDLFHLEDYFVSSAVSGPAYVLCVRVRSITRF